ncbi:MAG: quinolinate synthase NadA [Desulfovibrio sp.]|jgi:quinolinate synthase|nr:quinolinate synthase NadA [Desulfovibrio sp.]
MNATAQAITDIKKTLGKNVYILGHHYQNDAIVAHCDKTGDSLELSRCVPDIEADHIVFCGVHFMGETAALLARPGQSVHLPDLSSNCTMSMMTPAAIARKALKQLTASGRKITPLAYVNTTLDIKALVGEYGGGVCTSANAGKMLAWALKQGDSVLFLPDKHLGRNTAKKLGLSAEDWHILRINKTGLADGESREIDRPLLLWPGCCCIHTRFTPDMIAAARAAHPGCRILAHPESRPEVIECCDADGSTAFLIKESMRFAEESPGSTLYIATEYNLVHRLATRCKGRCRILSPTRSICGDMAKVTAKKLLRTLTDISKGKSAPLAVEPAQMEPARLSLTRMLEICA